MPGACCLLWLLAPAAPACWPPPWRCCCWRAARARLAVPCRCAAAKPWGWEGADAAPATCRLRRPSCSAQEEDLLAPAPEAAAAAVLAPAPAPGVGVNEGAGLLTIKETTVADVCNTIAADCSDRCTSYYGPPKPEPNGNPLTGGSPVAWAEWKLDQRNRDDCFYKCEQCVRERPGASRGLGGLVRCSAHARTCRARGLLTALSPPPMTTLQVNVRYTSA